MYQPFPIFTLYFIYIKIIFGTFLIKRNIYNRSASNKTLSIDAKGYIQINIKS